MSVRVRETCLGFFVLHKFIQYSIYNKKPGGVNSPRRPALLIENMKLNQKTLNVTYRDN